VLHLTALALIATTLTTPCKPHRPPVIIAGSSAVAAPERALTAHEVEYLLTARERRVRAMTPRLQRVVTDGLRRSFTFAAIMRALEDSDVIVQLVEMPNLPSSTGARLVLANGASDVRFLRVQVGFSRLGDDMVALVGHELFHALELAAAPEVRSEQQMAAYYQRIGFRSGHGQQFDTHEARTVERRIHRELGGMILAGPAGAAGAMTSR
jgi:hypothetical protein